MLPPLPGLGGLGPEGGGDARQGRARAPERWQLPGQSEWEEPRKARAGGQAPGQSGRRSPPPTRAPSRGTNLTGRPSPGCEGPKPRHLRSGPPFPEASRPPRAWQTPSPPGPVPGVDGGREVERGGPLTAGPELRCFSGPRVEETGRTG